MPKRKKSHHDGPKFHPDFIEPTKAQRKEAIGTFPCPQNTAEPRLQMIEDTSTRLAAGAGASTGSAAAETVFAPTDLDDAALYQPTNRSETTFAIPKPRDEQDWLANVPEEPETFDDYTEFLMSKSGQNMRPICNATRDDIVLLPIVKEEDKEWPNHGVPLEPLVELTKAYFQRPVRLLPPAVVSPASGRKEKNTTKNNKTTTTTTKKTFHISFPTAPEAANKEEDELVYEITGRVDEATGRTQYDVRALLSSLVNYRDDDAPPPKTNKAAADGGPPLATSSFCIMALTMEDLFQHTSDLFIAGLAAGGSKVAVFSFGRYHPHIKIHPQCWSNYGYGTKADDYSYFDGKPNQWPKQRKSLQDVPPTFRELTPHYQAEFVRRCGKILVHELMHLYGLGHCIFNRCIMMGTGHLVEDFAAPFHLCGVCLRKMQWRLGFSVLGRYQQLTTVFGDLGLIKEEKWTRKQVKALADATKSS